jgi:predicted dinucleotide-binding enzyme
MHQTRRQFLLLAGAAVSAAALPLTVHSQDRMKIGVIGSGQVGSALGAVWVDAGHEVMFSSRHIEHDEALASDLGGGARAGTPREAAEFGDVILMAVPYGALPDLGEELAAAIDGKVVIDACNPFPDRDGDIATWAREKGAGLASAELLPGARIVRAFNAIGARSMGSAYRKPGEHGMPIAADDAAAIAVASDLIREIGYEPVLIGGLEMGRYLMPGTPLAGQRSAAEIREIAASLN